MRTNNEIVSAIKTILSEKGMSLRELGRQSGISRSALSNYFNNTRELPLKKINDIAAVLGTTPENLLGFQVDKDTGDNQLKRVTGLYKQLNPIRQNIIIDELENQLASQQLTKYNEIQKVQDYYRALEGCSESSAFEEVNIYATADIQEIEVREEPIETVLQPRPIPTHNLAFRVRGNSMIPSFYDGEIIYISMFEPVRPGDIGIFRVNGKCYVRKLRMDKETKRIKLIPLNLEYNSIEPKDKDTFEIVGKVVR